MEKPQLATQKKTGHSNKKTEEQIYEEKRTVA